MTKPNLSTVTRIYYGRDIGCRCGCKGTYADVGTKLFTTRLKKLQKLIEAGLQIDDSCPSYQNFAMDNNKAFTVYFD